MRHFLTVEQVDKIVAFARVCYKLGLLDAPEVGLIEWRAKKQMESRPVATLPNFRWRDR